MTSIPRRAARPRTQGTGRSRHAPRRVLWIDVGGVVLRDPRPLVAERLCTEGVTRERLRTVYYRLSRRLDTDGITLRTMHGRLRKALPLSVDYQEFRALVCDQSLLAYPSVLRALRRLRKAGGVHVVFTSNVSRPVWRGIERKFALRRYADASVLSFRLGTLKPSPRFFRAALRMSRTVPREVCYLDDAQENVDAARRMGIPSWRVSRPEQTVRYVRKLTRND